MLCHSCLQYSLNRKKTFDFVIYLNRHSFATQIMRDQMWKKHAFLSSFRFCIGLPSGSLLLFFQPEMGKNWNQIWLPYNLPKVSFQITFWMLFTAWYCVHFTRTLVWTRLSTAWDWRRRRLWWHPKSYSQSWPRLLTAVQPSLTLWLSKSRGEETYLILSGELLKLRKNQLFLRSQIVF